MSLDKISHPESLRSKIYMDKPLRVVIVGGGISGLAAAHRVMELSRERQISVQMTLLEASSRFGGLIETRRSDGYLLESGPDAFITEKPWALDLCRRLGLTSELMETNRESRRSFIYRAGKLIPVPEGWFLIAPASLRALLGSKLVSWHGKLRMALEPFIPARRNEEDESVGQFIRRRFGREALEHVGQPMIGGIYAADANRLSLNATLPRFRAMEREHGSLMRALRSARVGAYAKEQASGVRYSLFMTLRGGMSKLVEAITQRLPEDCLKPCVCVKRVTKTSSQTYLVHTADGGWMEADRLCLAMPAPKSALLFRTLDAKISRSLEDIPYATVLTVNLAFRKKDVKHPLNGFGLVTTPKQGCGLIGCTFSSVKFSDRAPEGNVLIRAFLGGNEHLQVCALDEDALRRRVMQELRQALAIEAEPLFVSIHRHVQAMPQYSVGHSECLAGIEQHLNRHPGLFLTGNGYRGLGLPDCIHQAETVAERMLDTMN